MKKIVCELCEGTEFAKDGGMFICQGCGTKYTVEEARGMMVEVEGDAPAVTNSAPSFNINQQQLDNILTLANSAYEADNKKEAESYCNRAIELDTNCYQAWFLKGKAVGWQSTIDNLRIEEAAHSFCRAIDCAPEDEKETIKDDAVQELKDLGIAIISLRKNRFSGNPVKEELNGFTTDRRTVMNALKILLDHGNSVGIPEGYLFRVATLMNDAGVAAVKMARDAWANVAHPTDKDLETYLDWMGNCEQLFREAIEVKDYNDEADITRYENLIVALEDPINKCSYKQEWNSWSSSYEYVRSKSLTDAAIQSRRRSVNECKAKIAALKQKIADEEAAKKKAAEEAEKRRIEEYWEAHKEEKEKLEAERADLEGKVKEYTKEFNELENLIKSGEAEQAEKTPSEIEEENVHNKIKELSARRERLGLFSGKEKKQIDAEVADLKVKLAELTKAAEEERTAKDAEYVEKFKPSREKYIKLRKEIDVVKMQIATISSKLSKAPNE